MGSAPGSAEPARTLVSNNDGDVRPGAVMRRVFRLFVALLSLTAGAGLVQGWFDTVVNR